MSEHKMHIPDELFPQIEAASISQQPITLTGTVKGEQFTFIATVKRVELPQGDAELFVQPISVMKKPNLFQSRMKYEIQSTLQ